jgi:hypothetical protein
MERDAAMEPATSSAERARTITTLAMPRTK